MRNRTKKIARVKNRKVNRRANRAGKNRRLRRGLAVFTCLVLGAALGAAFKLTADYVRRTPFFNITEVVITNAGKHVTAEDVKKLSGIREGRNIFSFHLTDAIEAVRFHPWVKTVSMRRQLPDRVIIEVEERMPIAIVAMGPLFYIDEDLEIFKKIMPWDDVNFPVITGLTMRDAVENGPELKMEMEKAAQVLELAGRSKVLPLDRISEIHLDGTLGVQLWTLREAVAIRLGDAEFKKKWNELERVIVELEDNLEKVAVLDLNCEGRVTARLKQGYQVAREEATLLLRQ